MATIVRSTNGATLTPHNALPMPHLYLFNPDHDEAIAHNKPNYIADKASQALSADLATLVAWLAHDGDAVAVPDVPAAVAWSKWPAVAACLPAVEWVAQQPSGSDVAAYCATLSPQPWGWNPQVARRLGVLGCTMMPNDDALAAVREVAHRQTAAQLLARLKQALPEVVGEMCYAASEEEVIAAITVPHVTLLKLPWSGSGRGLRRGFGGLHAPLDGWVRHALAKQGGVMVEPFYDKVADLAMEFYADAATHTVRYVGMSCFSTTGVGGYAGNRLAADERLMAEAEKGLRRGLLAEVRDAICQHLPEVLGGRYTGPLGIDMMTLRLPHAGDALFLHPCVEINMRYTMGHVACALSARLAPGVEGRFAIAYARTPEALWEQLPEAARQLLAGTDREGGDETLCAPVCQRENMLGVAHGGGICAGYLPLSPLTSQSLFHAYVLAERVGG